MEISLQPKLNYKSLYTRRKVMISEEKLHIQDAISREQFFRLYEKYGKDMSQKDFAKYFLDIDYASYYKLQAQIRDTAVALTREFYLDEELDEIRIRLLVETGIKPKDQINNERLLDLHKNYGGRFSLKMFAEETLALNAHRVDDLNFKDTSKAVVLNKEFPDRTIIRKVRESIVNNEPKLHMGAQIKLSEFEELYQKYVISQGFELDKKIFALKVLGITNDTYLRFENGKRETVMIFSTYPMNPEYIANLREKVILSENLHINDSISVQRFDELYENYGGILTQELFAEEILDTSVDNVKNSRRRKNDITILTKIEIPEEYVLDLRNKVVSENGLKSNDLKSLEEIRVLYKNYGYVLSEKQFATLVLGVPNYSYDQLHTGATQKSYILVDKTEKDFQEIRRKVISENKLHYDDEINYQELHRIHEQYGPTIREHIFAEKVLDISKECLGNLRNDKINARTHILLSEPLPSDEELLILKKEIIEKYNLHRRDSINYKKFRKLYDLYAGVMPEDMFAEKILDIQLASVKKIKYVKNSTTMILLKTFPSKEELKELKQKVRAKMKIYPGKEISLKQFEKCFKLCSHILTRNEFANIILRINNEKLRKITAQEVQTVKVGDIRKVVDKVPTERNLSIVRQGLKERLSVEEIAGRLFLPLETVQSYVEIIKGEGKLKKREKKELDNLRKSTSKILDSYIDSQENINKVEDYMNQVISFYANSEVPDKELEIFKESIMFTEGKAKYIEFFTRACISKQRYSEANMFINDNINNKGITSEEKNRLKQLQLAIRHAQKRVSALEMLINGERDIKRLEEIGISTVEALNLKRRFLNGEIELIKKDIIEEK